MKLVYSFIFFLFRHTCAVHMVLPPNLQEVGQLGAPCVVPEEERITSSTSFGLPHHCRL